MQFLKRDLIMDIKINVFGVSEKNGKKNGKNGIGSFNSNVICNATFSSWNYYNKK